MTRKKPPHLRLLEGNPGKRRVTPRGVTPRGDAEPPAHLTGYALTVWQRVVASMPPGTYRATDADLLAAWCSACADHHQATLRVAIEGAILNGPRGRRTRNPWTQVARDAARAIESLGKRLGLDPMARADLPPPPTTSTSNKFAGLVGINDGDENDQ